MATGMYQDLPTKFLTEPTSHLKCPVCSQLYQDPVINIKCGHTFCRHCVFSATHCPIDNSHCDTSQLVVNRLVVGQIEDLQIHCQHGLTKNVKGEWEIGADLCPEVTTLGQRQEHEKSCQFAKVPCPCSELCGLIQKQHLEKHRQTCSQVPCMFKDKGCNFHSTQTKVSDHSKNCAFQDGNHSNHHIAQKITEQELAISRLQDENNELRLQVSELMHTKDNMAAQLEKHWSYIQTLQQKVDALTSRFDQVNTSHNRRPMSASQISLPDSDTMSSGVSSFRTTSTSILSSRTSSPGRNYEHWEMPLQFKCIGTLRGHKDVVWSMTTRKGLLYSGGADGIIKIWSLEQLAKGCVNNITAHNGVIHCLATWGNNLISAGKDKTICLWDLQNNTKKSAIEDAHDNIICAMVVKDDTLFTSSFSVIKIWDLKTLKLKKTLTGASHWVRALALSRARDKLYSGSHNAIHVWDTNDNHDHLASIEHQCGSVYAIAVSKTYIIAANSGDYQQNIQVFNIETHEFVMNLCGHFQTVSTLVISPSGRFLFSASHDSNVQMWNLETLLPIQTLSRHQGAVNTLTLHGDFLLSGSEDHEIKVFRYFQIQ